MKIDLESLPTDIQEQIRASQAPKKPLFPVEGREYTTTNFQTKELQEMGQKIDHLIEAVNTLHALIHTK